MRGTVRIRCLIFPGNRITPACAGNSVSTYLFDKYIGGSPPRVRGTASKKHYKTNAFRITPACAGNRKHKRICGYCPQDHPRVCGEQPPRTKMRRRLRGSPPRVRGTDMLACTLPGRARITPACAGNSSSVILLSLSTTDHPRVCGEQVPIRIRENGRIGSPPRVRGTGQRAGGDGGRNRITPACAGNSKRNHPQRRDNQDHPRVCGEQCMNNSVKRPS